MKVKTWVQFEQEVDVEVSIADVMSSIASLNESDQLPMVLDCISSVTRVLRNIRTEHIGCMNEKQRELIGTALRAEADRYQTLTGASHG